MIAQSDIPEVRKILSETFRPTKRLSASEWAEQHRELKEGQTPNPGRWRNDFLPWIEPILNAFDDNPWCEGTVFMKPTQSAGSEIQITKIGHLVTYDPGPMLYLCSTQDLARDFSIDRFSYMIESAPDLKKRFALGKKNRETTFVKEFVGGKLSIAGAGSPNKLISKAARFVFMDEEDRLEDFPGMGSAREIAEKRVSEYETRMRTGIFSWAHPTVPDRGVALTFETQSDKREWILDCPHCGDSYIPDWDDVEITDRKPATARYLCPNCGDEVTDLERWRATKKGRFESQLDPDDPEPRFVGFHVSRLCHPRVSLLDLAKKFCACHSESQLQVFHNMEMGRPYIDASFVITLEAIRNKIDNRHKRLTTPSNTLFITSGIDVQKGPEQPTLYYATCGWTGDGNGVVIDYGKLLGFLALDALLRKFTAKKGSEDLRIAGAGIDYGWKTREVYSFCRKNHGGVPCIPVKHTPGVMPHDPTRHKKTKDPLHPEYGNLGRVELCRDHWMDRMLGRFHPEADPGIGGSIVLPIGISQEFESHVKSARRVEIIDRHGHPRLAWEKEKHESDDYLQALVYAEVIAVALGLDRLHEEIPQRPPDQDAGIREGLTKRRESSRGRPGGFVRGRRR